MAGYHCHQRMFGAELWTDPWLSENSNRREVMRAVIQLADGFGKFYNGSDLANRIKIMFFPIDASVTPEIIRSVLNDLLEKGAMCAYGLDGESFLHLPKWSKYQQIAPSKRGRSNIPDCPQHGVTYKGETSPIETPQSVAAGADESKPGRKPRRSKKQTTSNQKNLQEIAPESRLVYKAWNAKCPVPDEEKEDSYCRVFDDMHRIDKVSWEDIYKICNQAIMQWVPNGWLESPMKLRKPSKQYEDMKTWQVIKSKMEKSGNAKVEDKAATTVKQDAGLTAALAKGKQ